jgi:hypothetical protein
MKILVIKSGRMPQLVRLSEEVGRKFERCSITVVVQPEFADEVRECKFVNDIILSGHLEINIFNSLNLLKKLRGKRYDLLYVLYEKKESYILLDLFALSIPSRARRAFYPDGTFGDLSIIEMGPLRFLQETIFKPLLLLPLVFFLLPIVVATLFYRKTIGRA